jgi:hypothetical protein
MVGEGTDRGADRRLPTDTPSPPAAVSLAAMKTNVGGWSSRRSGGLDRIGPGRERRL